MKVLVFGAGGQLGRALVALAPAEAEVIALARGDCDITDRAGIREIIAHHRPRWIFNAAAYTAVDRAESDAATARLVNGIAPGWIAEAARSAGSRMVHISSDFVFDGEASRPLPARAPTSPVNVYGRTKLEGEGAVAAAAPDSLIVRTAWLYGRDGTNFLTTMLRRIGDGGELRVVADQIGTPTWVRSLAAALWALSRSGAGGVHHFTDAGVASWYDFAVAIGEEAAAAGLLPRRGRILPVSTAEYPAPARRPAFSVLDKCATWEILGGPAPHWRANMRACLRDYR